MEEKFQITKLAAGDTGIRVYAISCLNEKCQKLTLTAHLYKVLWNSNYSIWNFKEISQPWKLIPESVAKSQPDYIPAPIRQDYFEACRILELSPKASATLTRRCLQGMIRDFCNVSKNTLDAEIKALKELTDADKAPRGVTPESVDAIDHVRKIGNIGAHMEKDISLIVDIDPNEAQILLGLVENLFDEWYVARKQREERFASIAALSAEKTSQKKK